jgi:hypothetical protein
MIDKNYKVKLSNIFKNYLLPTFNYVYKITLLIGIYAFIVTISFYTDFIDIKGYHFDAVIKLDLLILIIIIIRYGLVSFYKRKCKDMLLPENQAKN